MNGNIENRMSLKIINLIKNKNKTLTQVNECARHTKENI